MRYLSYYGLEKNPFEKKELVKDVYESEVFKEGISRLEYLKNLKGIGLFIGIPGVGKTTLLREFKERLNKEKYNVIYISITTITKFEFLNLICKSLGIDTGECYITNMKEKIQKVIKREKEEYGKETIILIDNAEKMTKEMLMDMSFLYEFDYNSVDYTSLVLCGNEELQAELSKKAHESLRQRIICKYKVNGIARIELKEYIKTRLEKVNQTKEIFSENAINTIYNATGGVLRKINTIINLTLMIGYQKQSTEIDEEIVRLAVEEQKL